MIKIIERILIVYAKKKLGQGHYDPINILNVYVRIKDLVWLII